LPKHDKKEVTQIRTSDNVLSDKTKTYWRVRNESP